MIAGGLQEWFWCIAPTEQGKPSNARATTHGVGARALGPWQNGLQAHHNPLKCSYKQVNEFVIDMILFV